MKAIMAKLRTEGLKTLGGEKVVNIRDIQQQISYDPANPSAKTALEFPKSNVLQFILESGTIVSARPSGTEPKLKIYYSLNASDKAIAENSLSSVKSDLENLMK